MVVVSRRYCSKERQIPLRLGKSVKQDGWIGYLRVDKLPNLTPADTAALVSIALLAAKVVSLLLLDLIVLF